MDEKIDSPNDSIAEYDFHDGTIGKYARRYAEGRNVVLLAPDVAEAFPDAESVNEALRLVLRMSEGGTEGAHGKADEKE